MTKQDNVTACYLGSKRSKKVKFSGQIYQYCIQLRNLMSFSPEVISKLGVIK